MTRLRALKPGRYRSLRLSLFCGEPLPQDLAEAWSTAAPNSVVENLYGPTELTVACASYHWDPASSPDECVDGIVPIGQPFPGMTAAVVNDELRDVAPGDAGELVMDGPQRTPGYWRNAAATERSYITLPNRQGVYYRTGDRVRRPIGDGPMTFVGRTDHQVKVLGYRVELGEIESRLRGEPGVESAVALPWPLTPSGPGGIVAFVTGHGLEGAAIQSRLRLSLQPYAVPKSIHVLPALPHNANGKVDRRALQNLLEQSGAQE
jgi:acyl-coenzyme A synthetase/AMP-(fatty) acid ligase